MAIFERIKLTLEDGDFVGNTVLFHKQDGGMSLSSQNPPPAEPDVVYLTPHEIYQLRALITPPVTDEQINKLLNLLQDVTRVFDHSANARRINHHQVVREWLANLNQPANAEVN